jgi:hypothetical protein
MNKSSQYASFGDMAWLPETITKMLGHANAKSKKLDISS